ncbi:MAG: ADOP family duplicated permease [Gemmatimonadales bacterium]
MSIVRRWWRRLLGSFGHECADRDLSEELQTHLQLEIDDLVRHGHTPTEARRLALIRSGGVELAREACREQRGFPVLDHLRRDLGFAARMVRRSPGFTFVAVLSLALAIAAATAVFSLADAVFLTTLPVHEPEELVLVEWTGPADVVGADDLYWTSYDGSIRRSEAAGEVVGSSLSLPMFELIRARSSTLSSVFAFAEIEQLNVVDAAGASIARGQLATGDYYTMLGIDAALGRVFTADDDAPDAEPVAVLSSRYWQRRFGGDPDLLGRVVSINGAPVTVVGVTPPDFVGTLDVDQPADVTMPFAMAPVVSPDVTIDDLRDPGHWWVRLMGRRSEGVAQAAVEAELGRLLQDAWRLEGSDTASRSTVDPIPVDAEVALRPHIASGARGPDDGRRNYRLPTALLGVLAGLVLILACSNVAGLLLARAGARRGEVTMRLALGAGRRRVVTQLLIEALLLAGMAGVLGLALAWVGQDLLLVLQPGVRELELGLDARALMVATALTAATAVLFGLAPAAYATRGDLATSLKHAGKGRATPRGSLRTGLLIGQIAVSVMLLFGAAQFLGTLRNLQEVDVGFDQDGVLTFRVDPRLSQYEPALVPSLYRSLQEAYAQTPGIESATFGRHALLTGGRRTGSVAVGDQGESEPATTLIGVVGPDFFETMRIPVRMGRPFVRADDELGPPVAMVNESFVRTRMAGRSPVGRTLTMGTRTMEIVGVAGDARYYSVREAPEPTVYVPFLQTERGQAGFMLRTSGDPLALVSQIREVTRRLDPTLSLFDVTTQREAAAMALGEERVLATMTTVFAALALFLAAIGVYGVMTYATSRRTAEIGLRLALGAESGSILWLVSRPTIMWVVLGTAVGLGGALAGGRFFSRLLFGLSAADPRSVLTAVTVISVAALVAAYVPARRARRMSALEALRSD